MGLCLDLGRMYAKDFEKDNIGFCNGLPGTPVAMEILSNCYEIFVRANKIIKLEELPQEEKLVIWDTAKDFASDRLQNIEQMKILCKALYALEYMLK